MTAVLLGVARFYEHFIGSAVTKKYQVYNAWGPVLEGHRRVPCSGTPARQAQALMDICMVHFAPGPKLHQTLTFKADKTSVRLGCGKGCGRGVCRLSELH